MVHPALIALLTTIIVLPLVALQSKPSLAAQSFPLEKARAAPEFSHQAKEDWIQSKPLRIHNLRGKVVLIDFWTFDCWNCYRSFPWLNALQERYQKTDLRIIGVHSPEFDHERVVAKVVDKIREFGLKHPVMIDNNMSYWRAMKNRFWPSFYLIDKQGRIRALFVGETHKGDAQAKTIAAKIEDLLAE